MALRAPLHRLLEADFPDDHLVCRLPDLRWSDFQSTVAGFYEALPQTATKPWLLALESPFHFAAALLACWHRGHRAMAVTDHQAGTLAVLRPELAGMITDMDLDSEGLRQIRPKRGSGPIDAGPLDLCHPGLLLYTSGSTGQRKQVPKTLGQLQAELEVLERQWGTATDLLPRLSTVSHLHIYGLLFRLLWPLCKGAPFFDHQFFFWEELLNQVDDKGAILVSSPTHLNLLPAAAGQHLRTRPDITLFSSGGPLSAETACAIAELSGQAPIEVLGSTETGGIAYRQRTGPHDRENPWQTLPEVAVWAEDGLLEVRSPFLEAPESRQRTGDRAQLLSEGRFLLLGRADRIVKLSEKRISLDEVERRIQSHTWVHECRICVETAQKDGQDTQARQYLCAAVVLSDTGLAERERSGEHEVRRLLRKHLHRFFEPAVLPKRWRFPRELPRNSQGKLVEADVRRMFAVNGHTTGPDRERPRFPEIHRTYREADTHFFECTVPADLLFLEGHFPQQGVVAGVVQLHWVHDMIGAITGAPLRVQTLEAVKFHQLLMPGQPFVAEVRHAAKNNKWHFRLYHDGTKFSSGRIIPHTE
ncbi:Acyl-CoA synthetase [Sulfidibacter corallicola]|uniref:Acyl-CoA synthetase n=1 Tax=Sulfidibacter corallicola TaxID=2818388 RepID=A0A8A4TQX1_SULCO|nr:AMP-binding protein [Sulfidibacter corallicola]QTD52376.1 acyl-CoA synthetase [Sulfidibacter corallicola]